MKIRGAIFDMDGTLADSMSIWLTVASEFLKSRGKTPAPDIDKRMYDKSVFDTVDVFRSEYGIEGSDEEIMKSVYSFVEKRYEDAVGLKDGVIELLDYLKDKGIPMCIATATDKYISEPATMRLGIRPYMKEIFTVKEIGKGKSHPDIYYKAAELLGTNPSETVVFEDALYAVKTAKAAGFKVVGIHEDGYASDWEDVKKTADLSVNSPRELIGMFEE